jgi:hypothetical protein
MADHASTRRSKQVLLPAAQRTEGAQVEPRVQELRVRCQPLKLLDRIKRAIGTARDAPRAACA